MNRNQLKRKKKQIKDENFFKNKYKSFCQFYWMGNGWKFLEFIWKKVLEPRWVLKYIFWGIYICILASDIRLLNGTDKKWKKYIFN